MKYVFAIVALLLSLAGVISGEAKTVQAPKAEVQAKQSPVAMFAAHKNLPANLKQDNHPQHFTFKVRDQRLISAGVAGYCLSAQLSHQSNLSAKTRPSCFHLPHLRQLLFPNHYFW